MQDTEITGNTRCEVCGAYECEYHSIDYGVVTRSDFEAYVKVQRSGLTNMWDVDRVIELSDFVLTKNKCLYIMKNYSALAEEYGA